MASAMWSHATGMWQAMDRAGIQRPKLTGQQAADLYAFLAGRVAADKPGDAARGSKVFQAKFCASCHDDPIMGAPKLGGGRSPFSMVASLWQHGGGMFSRMVARNTAWQTLSSAEMGDLIAYLNTRK